MPDSLAAGTVRRTGAGLTSGRTCEVWVAAGNGLRRRTLRKVFSAPRRVLRGQKVFFASLRG